MGHVILLFAFSGFAGLVYESVWAGYLKLMAGHASYGQILSLVVFMGGLAVGSHLSARFVDRARRPWMWYGLAEIAIGLGALAYHGLFGALTEWLWTSGILEGMGVWSARLSIAGFGAALTLPWAILLGCTFPLMAAGLLRRDPAKAHHGLGWLYAANSLGGAFGCLVNSFVLVPRLGLPGALATAAVVNLCLGTIFVALSASDPEPVVSTAPPAARRSDAPWIHDATAFLTGFSSFLYEIAWIRMLALQLGSSTHSFDVMLAAFLTGLAFGGWTVRKGLDKGRPRRRLAWAQLAMATCAAASLLGYQFFFEARNGLNLVLKTSPEAFPFAQLFKFASAFLMMGPAAFFAGMTLPLLISWRVRSTGREEGLGRIYAWNTLGSLLGALGGGLVLLPLTSLKAVLVAGAAIDGLLGLALLRGLRIRGKEGALAVATIVVILLAAIVPLRSDILTLGAFRAHMRQREQIVYRKDGAASTVSIHLKGANHSYGVLRNNGKPDASLSLIGTPGAGDNKTQGTIAWAPYSTLHKPYRAVLIGLGSGMTAHYLLGDPLLVSLDVVEIEPAVFEMSRHFQARNHRIFTDPRMKFWAEDARTFFATHGGKWDLIVSEPSNPWVSGVASLFTKEFYRDMRRHLSDDGTLAQWLQSYEFRDELFLSILSAMHQSFPEMALHPIPGTSADVLLLAGRKLPHPDSARLSRGVPYSDIAAEGLTPAQVASPPEVTPRILSALVKGVVPNSDFAPIVDAGAEEAFFTKTTVTLPLLLAPRPTGWFRALDPRGWDTLHAAWDERWFTQVPAPNLEAFSNASKAYARSGVPITSRQLAWMDTLVPFPAWPEFVKHDSGLPWLAAAVASSPDLPELDRLRFQHRWAVVRGDMPAAGECAARLRMAVRLESRLFPEVFGTLWTTARRADLDRLTSDTACWAPLSWPEKLIAVQLKRSSGE
jgi:spermidine synthase